LQVYLDKNGHARGSLYLDDGESFDYRTKNEYISVEYIYKNNSLKVRNKNENSFYPDGENKLIKQVSLVGFDYTNMPTSVTNSITGK